MREAMREEALETAPPQKKAKTATVTSCDDVWDEDDWEEEEPTAPAVKSKVAAPSIKSKIQGVLAGVTEKVKKTAKVPKTSETVPSKFRAACKPSKDDLVPGTVVFYWEGYRGLVRDAFPANDAFWLTDEETKDIVKDEKGSIVVFKSADLELVAPPPIARPYPILLGGEFGGVLVLGTESHMMAILKHFGAPDASERKDPQQLIAIPCSDCEPDNLAYVAQEGVDESLCTFAAELRPDIHVAQRIYHLKHAIDQLGSTDVVGIQGYYCLCGLQLPFGLDTIAAAGGWERHWMEEICCQIDLCVTANGRYDEESQEAAAVRALGEQIGLSASDTLWDYDVQKAIREQLKVPNLPLEFDDVNQSRISVLVLPKDAIVEEGENGILTVTENPNASYLSTAHARETPATAARATSAPAAKTSSGDDKTLSHWADAQDEFKNLPQLPPGWMRIKSRSSGEIYYMNKKTQETTFECPELPLPSGWAKVTSKSTGKTYFFNASTNKSTFERPT